MRVDREIPNRYFGETDASYSARQLWYAFKDAVFYKERFFVKHQLLDILSKYMSENVVEIPFGQIFFRARIIVSLIRSGGLQRRLLLFHLKR